MNTDTTSSLISRILALVEVTAVFLLVMAIFRIIALSPLGVWERGLLQWTVLEYLVIIIPLLLLLMMTRKNFTSYGLTYTPVAFHFKVIGLGFFPIAGLALALNLVPWHRWEGALVISAIEILLLPVFAWVLSKRTAARVPVTLSANLPFLFGASLVGEGAWSTFLVSFLSTFLVVGPIEELLFRGYIQSRLNEAFHRPYHFFGVDWGWGAIIAAGFFALWHVFPLNPFTMPLNLALPWGLWTFFAGLIFSLLREKTGSILAPAILHGVLNFL